MSGAEQPFFLAVPEGDEDRAAGSLGQPREQGGEFEQAGDAGRVVVGSVVDEADGTVAVGGGAVADMVVVATDDHDFAGECRIVSAQQGEHVLHAAEPLAVAAVVAGGFESERFELLDDVGGGGAAAAGSGLASFERVVGEDGDVAGGPGGRDPGLPGLVGRGGGLGLDRGVELAGDWPAEDGGGNKKCGGGDEASAAGDRPVRMAGRFGACDAHPACRSLRACPPGFRIDRGRGSLVHGDFLPVRRGGRVVECASLLKTCPVKSWTAGSNPALSVAGRAPSDHG